MDEMTDFKKEKEEIHRHRDTSHDEIIASARAFEAYLKGD